MRSGGMNGYGAARNTNAADARGVLASLRRTTGYATQTPTASLVLSDVTEKSRGLPRLCCPFSMQLSSLSWMPSQALRHLARGRQPAHAGPLRRRASHALVLTSFRRETVARQSCYSVIGQASVRRWGSRNAPPPPRCGLLNSTVSAWVRPTRLLLGTRSSANTHPPPAHPVRRVDPHACAEAATAAGCGPAKGGRVWEGRRQRRLGSAPPPSQAQR